MQPTLRKPALLAGALFLSSLLAAPLAQAAPMRQSTSADVYILRKITVTPVRALNFGTITINVNVTSNTTVTVTPDNNVSRTGVSLLGSVVSFGLIGVSSGLSTNPGEASLTGEPSRSYVVTVPDRVEVSVGAQRLEVRAFLVKSANSGVTGPAPYTAAFSSEGTDSLKLGGTLRIPAGILLSVGNALTASVPVTVQYQ